MQKYIDYLIKKYNTEKIEIAFVQLFTDINEIIVKNNVIIKSILSIRDNEIMEIKEFLSDKNIELDLFDLVNIFEILIPLKDRKLNGAFFTPKFITSFISSQAIPNKDSKVCDPSCGCGAFLLSSAEFINKEYNKEYTRIIEENLFGVDIADYSIRRAKILLSLLTLLNKEDIEQIRFNLICDDSLKMDWKTELKDVITNGGFDVVIGNPPYVKFQDLSEELRNRLFLDWKTLKSGTYNLYFAFFELGVDILKNSGILGYITPNNYFTSLAGVNLRKYFTSNRLLDRIIDFNHIKLFDAQTYTCITFLTKKEKDYFYYERVDDNSNLSNLARLDYSNIYFKSLDDKKWRLLRDVDQENIKAIENLENRLGNVVDIKVGIATCKDSVYFIDGNTFNDGYYKKDYKDRQYLIEEEITKPIAKISDFKDQSDLINNKRRIIFPYKKVNGKVEIIKEEEIKERFPKCYEYLLIAKEELSTRDKGNVEYQQWFAYARTQGLNFQGKKLLTPTFSAKPRFLLEINEEALFCNGYAIYVKNYDNLFSKNNIPLEILSKILNSWVMEYYIKRTSVSIEGDYPCFQKNFIELFGIPNFTKEEIKFLKNEEDRKEIDKFLISKYGIKI
jgi:methylase of polypeptide subunit release factors